MTPQFRYFLIALFWIIGTILIAKTANAQTTLNIGLYTEHYIGDKSEYNESNDYVAIDYQPSGSIYSYGVARFKNSHYIDSHAVTMSYDTSDNCKIGAMLVHGYQGKINTHFKGLLIVPTASYYYTIVNNMGLRFNFAPAVFNISLEIKL